jgi:hypothetical protein
VAVKANHDVCRLGRGLLSAILVVLLCLAFFLVFVVVVSSPESYTSYYEDIYMKDSDPSIGINYFYKAL